MVNTRVSHNVASIGPYDKVITQNIEALSVKITNALTISLRGAEREYVTKNKVWKMKKVKINCVTEKREI